MLRRKKISFCDTYYLSLTCPQAVSYEKLQDAEDDGKDEREETSDRFWFQDDRESKGGVQISIKIDTTFWRFTMPGAALSNFVTILTIRVLCFFHYTGNSSH